MKHLLLFTMCLFTLVCNAQQPKIVYDNINSDGTRTMICSYCDAPTDSEIGLSFSLSATVTNGATIYGFFVVLETDSNITVNTGMKLLLKDNNDEVTTLSAMTESRKVFQDDGTFSIGIVYRINETMLLELSKSGVKKIRVEHSGGKIDFELDSRLIPWVIDNELPLLKEAVSTKKNIYSDF